MVAPVEATSFRPAPSRTAWELVARANQTHALSSLTACELERWLLSHGLAEPRDDGELVATDAGRELGAAIFGE